MASFCGTCGNALAEEARFCSKCGTPVPVAEPTGETREFLIPLPQGSRFRTLVFSDGDHILTKQQLSILGVARPEPADFLLHRGLTYIWRYHQDHAKARLTELESEGWTLAEPFEPKADFYGFLTQSGIKSRFRMEETRVPGGWGNKPALTIEGFAFMMRKA